MKSDIINPVVLFYHVFTLSENCPAPTKDSNTNPTRDTEAQHAMWVHENIVEGDANARFFTEKLPCRGIKVWEKHDRLLSDM